MESIDAEGNYRKYYGEADVNRIGIGCYWRGFTHGLGGFALILFCVAAYLLFSA